MPRWITTFLCLALLSAGCAHKPTWEGIQKLEVEKKYAEAIKEYEAYLVAYPQTPMVHEARLRMARCAENLGAYDEAIRRYQELADSHPGIDFEIKAYLGMGFIYRDHIHQMPLALDSFEKALSRFFNQDDVRNAIQTMADSKMQSAAELFTRKDFKSAAQAAQGVLKTFPEPYVAPDLRLKAELLVDRVDRGLRLQTADADQLFVVKEVGYDPSVASDFTPDAPVTGVVSAPNGPWRALVRGTRMVKFLYVGKEADKKTAFKLVRESAGASNPDWSPKDAQAVYRRSVGRIQKLDQVDATSLKVRNLYFAKNGTLGLCPKYDPTGTKIAFVYAKCLWVINANGTNKTKLKTARDVDPSARLSWSADGTMLRYSQVVKGVTTDQILLLDALKNWK